MTKFAAESALDTGDRAFALSALQGIEASHPDDWQAACLLARAYVERAGRQRDAEIARALDAHKRAGTPGNAARDFLLERIPLPNGSVDVLQAFEPWGPYRTSLLARVYDSGGRQILRLTLESGDVDQSAFAREHPDSAAREDLAYSLDGYGPDRHTPDGRLIQSHYTYAFFAGRPDYDTVRGLVLGAAQGTAKPLSSRTGPVVELPGPGGVKN